MDAPRAISEYNPEAKIIMMLREPLERAWSHYNLDKLIGYHLEMFENCLREEWEAIKSGSDCRFSYIRDSSYADAYKRYRKYFSENFIMIVDFDKFVRNQVETVKTICNFLDIPPVRLETNIVTNSAKSIRFGAFSWFFKNIRFKNWLEKCLMIPLRVY